MSWGSRRVAFLFLGETLLIPHLWPIVIALAAQDDDLAIDCWVATSVHETLLDGWIAEAALPPRVRVRRAPGYRALAHASGQNPLLPAKIPMLIRLIPHLLAVKAVICAEQTSLWLPRALPFLRWRFIKAAHGAGSMMTREDPRRRAAYRLLVPAMAEQERLVSIGIDPARIAVVGYVKAGFHALANPRKLFADDRRVVVYAPHWQRQRSSWWDWGEQIVAMLADQGRFSVIFAPHQRLVEKAPEVREVLAKVASLPHVHVDLDGFALVDGSYTASADIYLGDTSSQVVEFLMRPRPCVFLNAGRVDWRRDPDYGFWTCGEVVDRLDDVFPALVRARSEHVHYRHPQQDYAANALGDASAAAAGRAARVIRACVA